jgi:hypothetical protein
MSIYTIENRELSAWLFDATRGLCADASLRAEGEIRGHVAEAVSGYLDSGLDEGDARRRAVAELGDAYAANRRFRKTYLTGREYVGYWRVINGGWRYWFLVSYMFYFVSFMLFMNREEISHYADWNWVVAVSVISAVLLIIPERLLYRNAIRAVTDLKKWSQVFRFHQFCLVLVTFSVSLTAFLRWDLTGGRYYGYGVVIYAVLGVYLFVSLCFGRYIGKAKFAEFLKRYASPKSGSPEE